MKTWHLFTLVSFLLKNIGVQDAVSVFSDYEIITGNEFAPSDGSMMSV